MELSLDFLLGVSSGGIIAWFAKEFISSKLRGKFARAGNRGVIESAAGVYRRCEMEQDRPTRVGFYVGINSLTNFEKLSP